MILAMGASLAASASAVPILIDDFSSLTPQATVAMGLSSSGDYASGGTTMGGSRSLVQAVMTSDFGLSSSITVVPGAALISNDAGNSAIHWLGYGGTSAGPGYIVYSTGTNFNMAGTDAILVDMLGSDHAFTMKALFYSDYSVMSWSKAFGPMGVGTIAVTAADLEYGAADMANVDLFILEFDTVKDGDLGLSKITAVPEPATMGVLGLGALGLIRRRNRK